MTSLPKKIAKFGPLPNQANYISYQEVSRGPADYGDASVDHLSIKSNQIKSKSYILPS